MEEKKKQGKEEEVEKEEERKKKEARGGDQIAGSKARPRGCNGHEIIDFIFLRFDKYESGSQLLKFAIWSFL